MFDEFVVGGIEYHVGGAPVSPISSGSVNAESAGLRRAATMTSRTAEARRARNAVSGNICPGELFRSVVRNAGDIESDVTVADDDHPRMEPGRSLRSAKCGGR